MLIVSEVLTILKWEAFWKTHNKSAYNDVVTSLETLQESMCNKDREGTFSNLKEFQKKNNQLKKDFSIFTEECKNISQIFHYFEYFLYMMSLLKQLIATDRNGNWENDLQTVQSILPIFSEFDSINYFRYGSFYLEQMRILPQDYFEIYYKIMNGLLALKQKRGCFNAVAVDSKLNKQSVTKPTKWNHRSCETKRMRHQMGDCLS